MRGKIFKIIIHSFCWIGGFLLYIFVGDPSFKNLIANISVIIVVIIYLFPWADFSQEKDLLKEQTNGETNIYRWLDTLNGGDNYLRSLFENFKPRSLQENITFIYKSLLNETNSDIEEIRLLRAYFKAYKDKKATNLYFKTIGTGLLSFTIFSVQAILQGRIIDHKYMDLFNPYNSWGFIFSMILVAIYFLLIPHRGENKLNLIINILDESVEELNRKNKNNRI